MLEGLTPAERDNLLAALISLWLIGMGALSWTLYEDLKGAFRPKSKVAAQEQCKLHSRPLKDCPAESHEPKDTDGL